MMQQLIGRLRQQSLWPAEKSVVEAEEKPATPQFTYLCEQDGAVEQELKSDWVQLFLSHPDVVAAYLVRIQHHDHTGPKVALCLRAGRRQRQSLIELCAARFRDRFAPEEGLLIQFLSEAQEQRVRVVAHSFYDRSQYASPFVDQTGGLPSNHAPQIRSLFPGLHG
ncbi:MAG: hypothetical protein ACYC46_08370 [Acidobacteriaceae bacterium]